MEKARQLSIAVPVTLVSEVSWERAEVCVCVCVLCLRVCGRMLEQRWRAIVYCSTN